jgi:hypothetical protein
MYVFALELEQVGNKKRNFPNTTSCTIVFALELEQVGNKQTAIKTQSFISIIMQGNTKKHRNINSVSCRFLFRDHSLVQLRPNLSSPLPAIQGQVRSSFM